MLPTWQALNMHQAHAQAAEAAELAAGEALELPPDLDYGAVQLSAEDAEKLAAARPANLAAAQRIPGARARTRWWKAAVAFLETTCRMQHSYTENRGLIITCIRGRNALGNLLCRQITAVGPGAAVGAHRQRAGKMLACLAWTDFAVVLSAAQARRRRRCCCCWRMCPNS